ncbi:MAG: hypothetical protein FJ088_07905 [Deltaproteobacteria bacterium]|nr:hypothetical protein [Deltaproteobacteria bacterium]
MSRIFTLVLIASAASCSGGTYRGNIRHSTAHPALNLPPASSFSAAKMGFDTGKTHKKANSETAVKQEKKEEASPLESEPAGGGGRQVEVKPYQNNVQPEVMSIGGYDKRDEIVESAKRLIGIKDSFDRKSFIAHILKVNNIKFENPGGFSGSVLPGAMAKQGTIFREQPPLKGDLVFLNYAEELNTGVIEGVREDGTVEFIAYLDKTVNRYRINIGKPEVRKDEKSGEVVNSLIKINGSKGTVTAGKLFAGFGRIVK